MTTLAQKEAGVKKKMEKYRQVRAEIVRFLRENLGLTFGEIGQEFGVTRSRAFQLYQESKIPHPFAYPDMKNDERIKKITGVEEENG